LKNNYYYGEQLDFLQTYKKAYLRVSEGVLGDYLSDENGIILNIEKRKENAFALLDKIIKLSKTDKPKLKRDIARMTEDFIKDS